MIHRPERPLARRLAVLLTLSALLTLFVPAAAAANPLSTVMGTGQQEPLEPVPGEIIVKFRPEAAGAVTALVHKSETLKAAAPEIGIQSLKDLGQKHGVYSIEPVFRELHQEMKETGKTQAEIDAEIDARFPERAARAPADAVSPDLSGIFLLRFPEEADVKAVAADYSRDLNVEEAGPNNRLQLLWTPNDPYYGSSNSWGQGYRDMWNLWNINAGAAWDVARGAGIIVAVVDTGMDLNHVDRPANIHSGGYNFVHNNSNPADDNGHGTHVTGIIAARGNNGIGVIGLAPEARILPLKSLNYHGGATDTWLANAIRRANDRGAAVQNYSWGGYVTTWTATRDAIIDAHASGGVLVAAAGNDSVNMSSVFPANMWQVIAVSSVNHLDVLSDFSNYGNMIDVAAPGGGHRSSSPFTNFLNVLSLRAAGTDMFGGGTCIVDTRYYRAGGTSMAAPHVSALAALILSELPTIDNERVRQMIRQTADDLGNPGFDPLYGHGRINAEKAMQMATISVKGIKPLSVFLGTGQIDATVTGTGFHDDRNGYLPQVSLLRASGGLTINATSVEVVNDTTIKCRFNLTSATEGGYSLRVKNTTPGGKTATKNNAFRVVEPLECGMDAGASAGLLVGALGLLSFAGFTRSRRRSFFSAKRSGIK